MRKFFIALLAVVCTALSCLSLAACSKEPTYYILTYNSQEGVTWDFGGIESGAEVKSGYTVNFKVTFDEDVEGSREVSVNDTKLDLNEEGAYSFVMEGDTNVSVNAWLSDEYNVKFDMGDYENMMWFLDEDGNDIGNQERSVRGGDSVSFKLKTSVYCSDSADKIKVTANTMVLSPNADGVYSFAVVGNTNVSVVGLQTDEDFLIRNEGTGTADKPFLIRKPVDLLRMAAIIEDPFYAGRYATMSYKLAEDIDLNGEKLYIIGEYPDETSIAMFCGTFDGDGHKISNYYIDDYIIDQSTGVRVALGNVGMFGVCSATVSSPVVIKNLTLENFEMNINGANLTASGFYAGGIVGYGVGVEITNCRVSGTINAYGNNEFFSNVGGIIGYGMSVYQSGTFNRHAVISGCSSDVEIVCPSGNIYAAGGIAGIFDAAEDISSAYITDCYSTGNVSGAIYAGGIVGNLGTYSSVANCYATGEIVANSRVGLINGSDIYARAYGGGIVGYAGGDTVVSGCLFTGEVFANATQGTAYTGKIIGGKQSGDSLSYIDSREVVANYKNAESLNGGAEFFRSLGWSESVWNFGEGLPTLKSDAQPGRIDVTVVYVNKQVDGVTGKIYTPAGYMSMAEIYESDLGLTRFINADDGFRSYGYFFDSALTDAVPLSFVPTGAITIYAGFADYSKVAGTYYFRTQNGSSFVYAELDAQGNMLYRNGALNYTTFYVFDGENVILDRSPATVIDVPSGNGDEVTYTSYQVTAKALFGEGASKLNFDYKIYANNIVYLSTIVAVAESDFATGVYYSDSGSTEYTFYKDGSGSKGLTPFVYTVDGNSISMELQGQTAPEYGTIGQNGITVNGVLYTAYDALKGKWERIYAERTRESYTFDGKGGWEYELVSYGSDGLPTVKDSRSGSYEFNGDTVTLDGSTTLRINGNGFVEVTSGDLTKTYYKENSFEGKWTFTSIKAPTTLEFKGIGSDGYGEVLVSLLTNEPVAMTYEIINGTAFIFDKDVYYGSVTYSNARGTLEGEMFVMQTAQSMTEVVFCKYDDFYGEWTCGEEGAPFQSVRFNGLGGYDMAGTANYSRVRGTVRIGNSTVNYELVTYTEGKFTYADKEYTVCFDEASGTVTITADEEYTFTRATN